MDRILSFEEFVRYGDIVPCGPTYKYNKEVDVRKTYRTKVEVMGVPANTILKKHDNGSYHTVKRIIWRERTEEVCEIEASFEYGQIIGNPDIFEEVVVKAEAYEPVAGDDVSK